MKTARKRAPANDLHPETMRKLSYVVLNRPIGKGKKTAVGVVLVLFILVLLVGLTAVFESDDESGKRAGRSAAQARGEPFDIVLGGPSGEEGDSAITYSPDGDLKGHPRRLPPILEVSVEGQDADQPPALNPAAQAQKMDAAARKLSREGDMKQALIYQRRSVELAPRNMEYRLRLAIIHDNLSNMKAARKLYEQVIQAFEKGNATLPRDLDIQPIRARAEFLGPMAQK